MKFDENSAISNRGLILLLDDDANFLTLMRGYLSYQGYSVVTATLASEAIEVMGKTKPDLILSAIIMPETDGYQFVRIVRQKPEINWIPIILVSARDQSSDRVRGLASGANAYFVKPFDLEELTAQIESSLQSSHLMQENRQRRVEAKIRVPQGVRLTNTELIVAKLVSQGMSNLEIADRLKASKRTIESHISHMLKKTTLNNRTELSRWILENDMA
jgi:DNA-binding NarL/FixJ family response regulator